MKESQSVQVRKSQIRSTPSFLGEIVMTVQYGDKLQVIDTKGSWVEVKAEGTKGWMHSSALTKKEIAVSSGAGTKTHAASNDEIALAGKGFNKQVEDKFRQKNKNLDFAEVDRIESFVVSQTEIEAFLQEGGLVPEGGVV